MADEIDALIDKLISSRKYRDLGIPVELYRDLLSKELAANSNQREAVKAVKEKLHNIVAPYLGDPDYAQAALALEDAFRSGAGAVEQACRQILATHASTRERIPSLAEFYTRLFEHTGRPETILDLACGLNPFAFPWMGLPASTRYHAYDIHRPRVELINHYFRLQGLAPLAEVRDVIVSPPEIRADVAFFFKEAHRFEQRQKGVNRPFWQSIPARFLLVSLPASSLTGRHDLAAGQRRLVQRAVDGLPWAVEEIIIGNEMVFIIEKPDA